MCQALGVRLHVPLRGPPRPSRPHLPCLSEASLLPEQRLSPLSLRSSPAPLRRASVSGAVQSGPHAGGGAAQAACSNCPAPACPPVGTRVGRCGAVLCSLPGLGALRP
ncbi:unnamed protein product [Rangifer tarandus platyrhynchus]|uniref:Uncharacterized protein n=1 Tax=Rangifer tarandus platyrhynchus TaxID=3082113 RepID=A0AC59YZ15_RANTA